MLSNFGLSAWIITVMHNRILCDFQMILLSYGLFCVYIMCLQYLVLLIDVKCLMSDCIHCQFVTMHWTLEILEKATLISGHIASQLHSVLACSGFLNVCFFHTLILEVLPTANICGWQCFCLGFNKGTCIHTCWFHTSPPMFCIVHLLVFCHLSSLMPLN